VWLVSQQLPQAGSGIVYESLLHVRKFVGQIDCGAREVLPRSAALPAIGADGDARASTQS
jgi:hypothetical protein